MSYTLNLKETIEVGTNAIESVRVLDDKTGVKVLVSSRDKKVVVIDVSKTMDYPSRLVEAYEDGYAKKFMDAVYSPVGNKIIAGSGTGKLYIFDRTTKKFIKYDAHEEAVTSIALNAANNKIVTASQDKKIKLWNVNGEKQATFDSTFPHGHKSWINAVEFIPNSEDLLVSAGEDGALKIWDMENLKLVKTYFDGQVIDYERAAEMKATVKDFDFECAIKAISFSKDGSLLAFAGRKPFVYFLNVINNEFLQGFETLNQITALAYAETHPVVAVAIPNKILLWNIIDSKPAGEYEFSTKKEIYCRSLVFTGNELFVALDHGRLLRIELIRQ